MAGQVRQRWSPTPGSGLPRRDREGCEYEAYLPDPLSDRVFQLRGDVAADVADAESAIQRLNLEATALANSEGLARLLLRAEAVASSKIEGLEIGGRRLLRAEMARVLGDDVGDVTAEEILGNVNAMAWTVTDLAAVDRIEVDHLREIHRRLLAGTRLEDEAGRVRDRQNWIGGSDYNPCRAEFVPPPPSEVPPLLNDLCAFCNQDNLPAVAQAAVAHAQFETIHPFADGNGRTGRALIQVILRRRGLAPRIVPPVSLVLATWSSDYVQALSDTRYLGDPDSPQARDGANRWIALFAAASRRAVDDARLYEGRVRDLQARWQRKLGRIRRGSSADLLMEALPGTPILTVATAATLIGRSFQAANQAVRQLTEAGVLRQIRVGRRNRAFEASELIEAFNDLERRLASPRGDTQMAAPSRPVPRWPRD
ncbi:MAG: Fic family protein [Candidatus Dormibacterales bacterium]